MSAIDSNFDLVSDQMTSLLIRATKEFNRRFAAGLMSVPAAVAAAVARAGGHSIPSVIDTLILESPLPHLVEAVLSGGFPAAYPCYTDPWISVRDGVRLVIFLGVYASLSQYPEILAAFLGYKDSEDPQIQAEVKRLLALETEVRMTVELKFPALVHATGSPEKLILRTSIFESYR